MKIARLGAGVLAGLAAALALTTPAQAGEDHTPATVTGQGECADTGWTANITITNISDKHTAVVKWVKVLADGDEVDLEVKLSGTELAKAGEEGDSVTGTIAVPEDLTAITVRVNVTVGWTDQFPSTEIKAPEDCGPPPTESPSPSPSTESPAPSASASEAPPVAGSGGGSELPVTGASIGTAVGIAVVLLAAGTGLFFFFRRRRIRFTA
jgi:LPXTG-motif cell wall-anchored protein